MEERDLRTGAQGSYADKYSQQKISGEVFTADICVDFEEERTEGAHGEPVQLQNDIQRIIKP